MSEYDIEELNTEFAGFRAGVPQVVSPGMDAARHTVRRRRRVRTATLSVLAVLIVAPVTAYAALGPDRDGPPVVVATAPGTPSPSAAESPFPSPFPSPSPSASASASPSASPSKQGTSRYTLGPRGYGALRLDMTAAQARATGLTTAIPATADCNAEVYLRGTRYDQEPANHPGRVWFDDGRVAVIWAVPGVSTPEGIRIGSTLAQVRKAYPKWSAIDGYEGHGYIPAPGNSDAKYRIEVRDGKVASVALHSVNRGCYE
ncbi:hypothetical protein CS0771_05110 [Catellatospora sp. IY07-71]|uniref:hypothetical protein n=1 Tax=Catellatospora sp. IY07-71 TaxID=2728827 RepID=UPI001BB3659F|nr:hypothetical protein [Catellatospora sp. IY07-71]BCJ70967.1 hypothetical protein CS0771_05110 [Catellatospora sp. IY07-71]